MRHVVVQKVFEDYERDSYQTLIADIEKQDDQALQVSILSYVESYLSSYSCVSTLRFTISKCSEWGTGEFSSIIAICWLWWRSGMDFLWTSLVLIYSVSCVRWFWSRFWPKFTSAKSRKGGLMLEDSNYSDLDWGPKVLHSGGCD